MKKWCLSVLLVFLAVSLSFAGEVRKVDSGITTKSFAAGDVSFERAHVCVSTSPNCDVPDKAIRGAATLHIVFWSPVNQNFTLHWLVTDVAGTVVFYQQSGVFALSGFNTFELVNLALSPSDYTFTAIAQGQFGSAISDLYKFTVIP